MKFTCEKKSGVVLLIVGIFITAFTQILVNTIPPSTIFVTPSPDYPRWMPLKYKHWMGPFGLVRYQEVGLMALSAGVVLLIRPHPPVDIREKTLRATIDTLFEMGLIDAAIVPGPDPYPLTEEDIKMVREKVDKKLREGCPKDYDGWGCSHCPTFEERQKK